MAVQISFDDLVAAVTATAPGGAALDHLRAAAAIAAALADHGDALVTHFVERCRRAGHSWSEVGAALGVSKQAVQQRFSGAWLARLTPRTRVVLERATEIAHDQGAAALRMDHLVGALLVEPDTIGARVLAGLGVTEQALDAAIARRTRARGARLDEAPPAEQDVLATALALGHNYVGTEHVLLAAHRHADSPIARALDDVGATAARVRAAVDAALGAA